MYKKSAPNLHLQFPITISYLYGVRCPKFSNIMLERHRKGPFPFMKIWQGHFREIFCPWKFFLSGNGRDESCASTYMKIIIIEFRFITGQLHQLYPDYPIFLLRGHQCPWITLIILVATHIVLWNIFKSWGLRVILLTSTVVIVAATTRVIPRVVWLWGHETAMLMRNVHKWATLSQMTLGF